MLQLCWLAIDVYVLHINICFVKGYFPSQWGLALLKPLPENNFGSKRKKEEKECILCQIVKN